MSAHPTPEEVAVQACSWPGHKHGFPGPCKECTKIATAIATERFEFRAAVERVREDNHHERWYVLDAVLHEAGLL